MTSKSGYWWWRLKYGFFNQHEMNYLRSLPHGNEKVLIYIEMITESIKHDGSMRFSDDLAWTPELMAPVVHTNPILLKEAWEDFQKIKLMIIDESGTIYLPMVKELSGFQTKQARYMKEYRNKKNNIILTNANSDNYKCNKVVRQSKELRVKNKELRNNNIYIAESEKNLEKYVEDFKKIFQKYYPAISKRFTTQVAKQKIESAIKQHYDIEIIKKGFNNYLETNKGIDIQYVKNFATFMNQEIWRDYLNIQLENPQKFRRTENKSNFDDQKLDKKSAERVGKLFEELNKESNEKNE